ncbi:alpha/beta fold hydrolase [Dysgonomonas sp. ZJ279]|uniref:alpha/beta fold hydrolase n=1 Tax=Dysgonomonas sp. ZJ279 TaxID=2709796 RepID=UPI0013EC432F|nr:alpha/beta hydrolase [Dysgonomonas sp. ZJ279]
MKSTLPYLALLTILSINSAKGQTIYSQSYGSSLSPAIIYVHGGPSSNTTLFEATTAQRLAELGFYVIAYDRRGEGRSADPDATFTFQESSNDLVAIYEKYNIEQANILAHSFGGIVATFFAEQHPEKVNSIILIGALFSQQETYDHILYTVEKVYRKNGDTQTLNKIEETRQLPKNTAEYRAACFDLADGFFDMPKPTKESMKLREEYQKSDFYKNNIRNRNAPAIFFQNETLNNVDTKPILEKLKTQNIHIFAIYGKQDRIFSKKQLEDMKAIVGKKNFTLIDNCSHFLYVDQQELFLETISKYMKQK